MVHLLIGRVRLTRSVIMPQTIMPTPMTRMSSAADTGRAVRHHPVGPVEVARQPGEQRAGDEQLQAAADVGQDHRRGGEERGQAGALAPAPSCGPSPAASSILYCGELALADHDPVEAREHQAEDAHGGEGPAPAELGREHPAERDAEHRAERAAGHERAGQRRTPVGGEDGEHDREADAAVGRLADPDEEPGDEQLAVVGGDRRADRWRGSRRPP